MASINKAILIGNLGKDPEVRYTGAGKAVTSFSIATTDKWKDKDTGENRKKTEWHRIVAFGRLGEICGEYLSKGKQVYIEGRIRTRAWEKDGITRYVTEIEAVLMQMLGNREGGGTQQQANKPQPSGQSGGQSDSGQYGQHQVTPPDDDIPF